MDYSLSKPKLAGTQGPSAGKGWIQTMGQIHVVATFFVTKLESGRLVPIQSIEWMSRPYQCQFVVPEDSATM
jgi:hypothetical protein